MSLFGQGSTCCLQGLPASATFFLQAEEGRSVSLYPSQSPFLLHPANPPPSSRDDAQRHGELVCAALQFDAGAGAASGSSQTRKFYPETPASVQYVHRQQPHCLVLPTTTTTTQLQKRSLFDAQPLTHFTRKSHSSTSGAAAAMSTANGGGGG